MQSTVRGWFSRIKGYREFTVLMAVVAVALFIYTFNQNFFRAYNIQGILRQIAIFSLMGIGETLVIITAGIDLSPGSILAFSGVIAGLLIAQGVSWPLAVLAVLAMCAAIGLYHGLLITRVKLAPFIATLGSLSIFRGLAVIITKGYPVPIKAEAFLWLGQGLILGIPVPFIILVIVAALVYYLLNQTAFGRNIYAIGGNIEAARLSGIPIGRVLAAVYALTGLLFGVSSIIMAGRLGQGMPGVGMGYELNAIAAAVIGGTSLYGGVGTVLGTIVGASLMALIDNLLVLLRVESWWNELVIGVVIVLAVSLDVVTSRKRTSG